VFSSPLLVVLQADGDEFQEGGDVASMDASWRGPVKSWFEAPFRP